MIEIVVDTNVLAFSDNESHEHYAACIELVNIIAENENIYLCVDENGAMNGEYLLWVKPGTLAFGMLLKLGERLKLVSRSIPAHVNKKINQTGIKTNDRIFVRIAWKTNTKILISDEHEDFVEKIRDILRKEIDVRVILSCEYSKYI